MRFGSLFFLMFLNIIWMPLEAEGYSVNGLTVNIFPDHENGVNGLPPALRQLLAGLTATKNCNSTHQKLQLGGDVNQEVETAFESVEVTDAPGPRESVELTEAPCPRDDRPVPDKYDVGSDGFSYFLGGENFDTIQECRGYCRRFRGFRLAIAKTAETLNEIRKYRLGMVDLAIIQWGANVKLLWGDGTPLDRSIVLANRREPIIDQPGVSDKFIMWPPNPGPIAILDDYEKGYKAFCVCQGSSDEYLF